MKKIDDRRKTYWYLVPMGQVTNEAIIRALGPDATDENEYPFLPCCDDKTRGAWEVPHKIITQIGWGKVQVPFKYEVWFRHEGEECAKKWTFHRRKPKVVQKMRKQLEALEKVRK